MHLDKVKKRRDKSTLWLRSMTKRESFAPFESVVKGVFFLFLYTSLSHHCTLFLLVQLYFHSISCLSPTLCSRFIFSILLGVQKDSFVSIRLMNFSVWSSCPLTLPFFVSHFCSSSHFDFFSFCLLSVISILIQLYHRRHISDVTSHPHLLSPLSFCHSASLHLTPTYKLCGVTKLDDRKIG